MLTQTQNLIMGQNEDEDKQNKYKEAQLKSNVSICQLEYSLII